MSFIGKTYLNLYSTAARSLCAHLCWRSTQFRLRETGRQASSGRPQIWRSPLFCGVLYGAPSRPVSWLFVLSEAGQCPFMSCSIGLYINTLALDPMCGSTAAAVRIFKACLMVDFSLGMIPW